MGEPPSFRASRAKSSVTYDVLRILEWFQVDVIAPAALVSPAPPLRIHLHDNSGHPFQVQLSRALASRGHEVLHTHMAAFQSPKGKLQPLPDDAAGLRIAALEAGEFPKYSYVKR